MLTPEQIEEQLGVIPAFDEGRPDEWPEMGMSARRCLCGRWLQIVRPGKYQCECESETVKAEDRERELLETLAAYAEIVEAVKCRGNCNGCPGMTDSWHTAEQSARCRARKLLEGNANT